MRLQVTRRSTVHRVAVGLLTVAAAVLLAPGAGATPESDANDAITAAWQASGGDAGPLGPRTGDVYPIGAGFGANFAGGKVFFTPQTGAHIMSGAILEKYESLGGPADSDLGFPTIDEGPGKAPNSRNSTFSASDNPVIFWTPETGAHVVRGPINAAWDKLGGSAGPLGVPTDDEAYGGALVTQKFTGGELSYNLKDKTFTTVPPELAAELSGLTIPDDPVAAINAARRAAGGPLGPLGAAQGEPYQVGQDGLAQDFAGGKIFYSPTTGASVLTGQVLAKYESVGGPGGDLGFPTGSEADGGLGAESKIARFSAEDKPVIFWTPDHGAVIVRGAMAAAWDRLGGARGVLGAPQADQTEDGNSVTQRFTGGAVSYDRSTKKFTTEPANLAAELGGLEVPEQNVTDTPAEPQADGGRKWFTWSPWWLLAIVPVVVLIGLVALATLRRRSSGAEDPFAFDEDHAEQYAPQPVDERSSDEDYAAAMFGDRYAREGLGALSPSTDAAADSGSFWGAPTLRGEHDDGAHDEAHDGAHEDDDFHDYDGDYDESHDEDEEHDDHGDADAETFDEDEDPDAVDTTPNPVVTPATVVPERNPMTDSGRHARIEDDEPPPLPQPRTAFRMALDDPNEAPEGYPVKANATTGRYWAPGHAHYDEARAEIWFATPELARANGFVTDD